VHSSGDGLSETDSPPWSAWGVRLLAALSIALSFSLAWAWIETFYRAISVSTQLSGPPNDKPYMPPPTTAKAIIGIHYFGDFQLPYGYATNLRHSISPYLGQLIHTQYPPIAQVFFLPFTFLPLRASALTYLFLSAVVFLVPLWLLLKPLNPEYRVMFLTLTAVLTTPFIALLDRGNDIGVVVGLITWGIWAWKSERWILCGAFLAAAIALKVYPASLLIVPFGLRRYKFAALVAASAVFVNLLAFLFYPGGFVENVVGWAKAIPNSAAVPVQQLLSSTSLYSTIPKTAGLVLGPSAADRLLAPGGIVTWLPTILYVGGVYLVIRLGRVPQWCWGPLSLASIQLCVPVSYVYTTSWASVAAVWFAWGYLVDVQDEVPAVGTGKRWMPLRITLLLALTASLTPSIFSIWGSGDFHTVAAQYLSPIFLLVALGMAIVHSMRPFTPSVLAAKVG
jgi:Glycosyltransferase family 87